MSWIEIDEKIDSTYPQEGIDVLVSDGINYDVAWYIRSGEFTWLKTDVYKDETNYFLSFVPIKWKLIE